MFFPYLNILNTKKKYIDEDSTFNNFTTRNMYEQQILNYALSRYEWINVPDGFDTRFMEIMLVTRGMFVAYYNKEFDKLMVSEVVPFGKLNSYFNPTEIYAYGLDMQQQKLDINNCVICYANMIRTNDNLIIEEFSKRLANITRTIDVSVDNAKTPYILSVAKNRLLTMKNIFKNIYNNKRAIYVDENLEGFNVIDTDVKYNGNELFITKNSLWNECMTFLGVNNANTDKKERQITDEVNSNNEQIQLSKDIGLLTRKEFCKKFNDMFGTDIDVRFRTFEFDNGAIRTTDFIERSVEDE